MIFPIGNTKSIRRLPFISLTLILLNIIIFVVMQPYTEKGNETVYQSYSEYLNLVAENMELKGMDSFDAEILAEEFKNPTVSEGDSLYEALVNAKNRFDKSNENHIFSRLGVSKKNLSIITLMTSMFVHADIIHLLGNLWFLFLLGFNIEDIYGRLNYLIFYILSGVVSSFLFIASVSQDPQISLIGASGAISGVMGAFLVKLYKTKIKFFYWFFPIKPLYGTFLVYAGFSLPVWFLQQIFESASNPTSGVAFVAHVGGFLFGVLTAAALSATKIEEKFISPKVDEASNLLGMNREEEDGVSAYLEGDYERAKRLLLKNFEKKKTYSSFVPLFVSLARLGDEALARKTMDVYVSEVKNDSAKIKEIFEDLKNSDSLSFVSNFSKLIFAKTLRNSKDMDSAREIVKSICETEKYSVFGYKTIIMAYEEKIEFEGIDSLAEEYLKNEDEKTTELRQTLLRRKNEKR